MTGISFPEMFDGNSVKLVSGVEAVISDLKVLFDSETYEYRFDPGYGSNVPLLRLRPKTQLTLDLLVDAICESQMFIPNIAFNRNSVEIKYLKGGEADVKINAVIDNQNYVTELKLIVKGMSES